MFVPGQEGHTAFFVGSGTWQYVQDPETSMVREETSTEVAHNTWVSEMSLWCHWCHVGKLESTSRSRLYELHYEGMVGVLQKIWLIGQLTESYAGAYHARLVTAEPPHSRYPDDVWEPGGGDYSDLWSTEFSMVLVKRAVDEGTLNISPEAFEELLNDIGEMKCAVDQDAQGELVRIVSLVTLSLSRSSDGKILVQVGDASDTLAKARPDCKLPGVKKQRDELPKEALERVLQSRLGLSVDSVNISDCSTSSKVSDSAKYGMGTKYLTTSYQGQCEATFQIPNARNVLTSPISVPVGADDKRVPNTSEELTFWQEIAVPADGEDPIFIVPLGNKISIYAWLTQRQFARLRLTQSDDRIQEWFRNLALVDQPRVLGI